MKNNQNEGSQITNTTVGGFPPGESQGVSPAATEDAPTFKKASRSLNSTANQLIRSPEIMRTPSSKPNSIYARVTRSDPCVRLNNTKKSFTSWNVVEGKPLPPFPIGRTENFSIPPSEVAKNLENFFRVTSVLGCYDSENSEVQCTTSCDCKFKVTLYADKTDINKTKMEIMRTRGCAFSFSRIRRSVIRAATGNFEEEKHTKLTIPDAIAIAYQPPKKHELENTLAQCARELQTKDLYGHLTNLTLLGTMTDYTKSHEGSSVIIAKMIIEGEANIREIFLNICSTPAKDDLEKRLQLRILGIFANCLEVLHKNSAVSELEESAMYWCKESLYPVLVYAVKICPCHFACTSATRCLIVLLKESSELLEKARKDYLSEMMKTLQERGDQEYKNLSIMATNALDTIQ